MKVKVYDVDSETFAETFRAECDLSECFPDDDYDRHMAAAELQVCGRTWVGGGAAPLVLLMRTE